MIYHSLAAAREFFLVIMKKEGREDHVNKSVKNGQLKKRASYGRIDISTIGGIYYAQRISTHTEL